MTSTSTVNEAAEILDKAADYIEKNGLARRVFKDSKGKTCAWGAIIEMTPDRYRNGRNPYAIALTSVERHVGSNIATWNDNPKRTKATIVKTMRTVAKNLRKENS